MGLEEENGSYPCSKMHVGTPGLGNLTGDTKKLHSKVC